MNHFQSSKKMTALLISFILLSILPVHPLGEEQQNLPVNGINQIDGVYYTESFEDTNLLDCVNEDKIILDPDGSMENNYNYSTWTSASLNRAYYFDSLLLNIIYPVDLHIKNSEEELTEPHEYNLLGELDGIYFPLEQYAEALPRKRMHHFRFKITQDINTTSLIQGEWYGKVENCEDLSIYVWKEFFGTIGYWEKIVSRSSNLTTLSLSFTISKNLPIQSTGFVDICVVLTPTFGDDCKLFTDFVNLKVRGEGYATKGTAQSPLVVPTSISQWEYATWEDYTPAQTDILMHVCYQDKNGTIRFIDEEYLDGNSEGFTQGPIDLSSIPTNMSICLQANLTTLDLSKSPEMYSWGFSWQTTDNTWKDSFSTDLRVPQDDIRNVRIANGMVTLLPSINNWPMFGQNPNNTRNTPGLGPSEDDKNLAWYTIDRLGGQLRNPIVQDGVLYIASDEGKKILAYNALENIGWTKPNIKLKETTTLPFEVKTSPAATGKDTIVVATASASNAGDVKNIVFGFDTSTLGIEWMFEYEDVDSNNPYICYESSPVVNNERIYLTTWSGDTSLKSSVWDLFNFSNGNNKVICLSDTGREIWTYDLPAASFSSPAVTDDIIIAGCENLEGSSLIALNKNGAKLWEATIGPIGYASPVIYDDIVFAVSKIPGQLSFTAQTQLVALNINNGSIIWNRTIGGITSDLYSFAAYNTPAVADDTVFVASPDGYLEAYDLSGEQFWEKQVYKKGLLSYMYLQSSPAYAQGILYIGTPDGELHAIDATDGSIYWTMTTNARSPILSSPIVVDGLVYITSENGMLECVGELQLPENEQITGSIISRPISLPDDENYTWNRFLAATETSNGYIIFSILDESDKVIMSDIEDGASLSSSEIRAEETIRLKAEFHSNTNGKAILHEWSISYTDEENISITKFYEDTFEAPGNPPSNCSIQVENDDKGIWNTSAKFKVQYVNTSGQQISDWLPANCTGVNGSKDRETIHVNLSEQESIQDVERFEYIRFSIKDLDGYENFSNWLSFEDVPYIDTAKPIFYDSSFTPTSQYITSPTPTCTIKAKDIGVETNTTGINVSSAQYTIEYVDQSGTKTYTADASCTGTNGIILNVTITADISDLSFADDIEDVNKIQFTISDMGGNENTSDWFTLTIDDTDPTSTITNEDDIPTYCNYSPVLIVASASDTGSGIQDVTLYYRLTSSTQWSLFGTDSTTPYEWDFKIAADKGGEYELCTIAIDKAGNEQSFPSTGEVLFVFDPNPPSKPTFASEYEFTTEDIPVFTDVVFKDDYKLKQVQYRMNFEGINEWTDINTENLNSATYTPTWNLTKAQWDTMIEDETYSIYFKIIDVLGNIYETPSTTDTLKLVKNIQETNIYDPDLTDLDSFKWSNEYTIRVTFNLSQISVVQLWYSYSTNETVDTSFIQYGGNLTNGSSSWTFKPDEGTGYYSFYIKAIDTQGTEHISNVKTVYVSVFPVIELAIFAVLLIVLFIISLLIFRKYKKKQTI